MLNSRWWSAALMAAMLSFSAVAVADANGDYDTGLNQYREGDMAGAMNTLRKAVDAGHVKAMVVLAEILDRSEFDEDAIELYRKAADLGDKDGMFGLGSMIAAGEGVRSDPLEGRRWILKAAELGHVQAIGVMANAYLKGELGFTEADRDTPQALHWVQLAAKNDYLPAVDALVDAYRNGGVLGVAADPSVADDYLAQANKIRGIDTTKKKKGKKAANS